MYVDRKFDRLFEFKLCFLMSTNVRPLYVRHIHSHLPHGAWPRISHGSFDIRERNDHVTETRRVLYAIFFQPTEGVESSVPNKVSKVSSYKPMCVA